MQQRVAIIGFGFSGLMLATHLVRDAEPGTEIYLIDPALNARGMAYGTPYDQHLLNVPAGNMSAFADVKDHFLDWLAQHHIHFTSKDFVPRRIYGDYLEHVWNATQTQAAERKIFLKLIPSVAVAMQQQADELAVITERGDAIAVDAAVLATGNEMKPVNMAGPVVQNPWAADVLKQAAKQPGPILLVGTGLTAVDVVLALRAEGYAGEIIAYSRNGLLPQPHREYGPAQALEASEIDALHTLRDWARWLRQKTQQAADWRAVVDGLRPFMQSAWGRLRTRQQHIFFHRFASFWSVHRHRMAPQIAQQLAADSKLRIMNRRQFRASGIAPALSINCTGPELNVERSASPLLRNLLAQRLVEPHGNGIGIAVDAHYRAWGEAYPRLFSIGALMTGQLLESTAVPELRVQAQHIAEALCRSSSKK